MVPCKLIKIHEIYMILNHCLKIIMKKQNVHELMSISKKYCLKLLKITEIKWSWHQIFIYVFTTQKK